MPDSKSLPLLHTVQATSGNFIIASSNTTHCFISEHSSLDGQRIRSLDIKGLILGPRSYLYGCEVRLAVDTNGNIYAIADLEANLLVLDSALNLLPNTSSRQLTRHPVLIAYTKDRLVVGMKNGVIEVYRIAGI